MQVRPITPDDEPALAALEVRLLAPHQTPRTGAAALRFFSRTGHSFVAEEGGRARGFVLAQALWQGDRATVLVTRLLADDPEVRRALLLALVKSAYDAAAYEVACPAEDEDEALFAELDFVPGPRLFVRALGSRGARGAHRGVLE